MNDPRIVITNSHACNRGDEAAQRSMVAMLRKSVPNARIDVLTDSPRGLDLPQVDSICRTFSAKNGRFPFVHWPWILIWLGLRRLGLSMTLANRLYPVLGSLELLAQADMVISCPGGPYFGDRYASHEIQEHLFHLFVSRCLKKPVMIYGPSMGPFRMPWRNRLRRWLLNGVEIITLRDPISAEYLKDLNLTQPIVEVTADSAFQDEIQVEPVDLDRILVEQKIRDPGNPHPAPLIGFTPAGARWNFPNAADPQAAQQEYGRLMARMLDHVVPTYDATVVMFPQLYGRSTDLPLIREIVDQTHVQDAIRVVSNALDSEIQQALISCMDMMIGNRYHSTIFSLKGRVPTVCLAYEHKAVGVMQEAGLAEYCVDVNGMTFEGLTEVIDAVWRDRDGIRCRMRSGVDGLKRRSRRNTMAAQALLECCLERDVRRARIRERIARLETADTEDRRSQPVARS